MFMKIIWKLICREIWQKPGRFLALAAGMTAAVFLITTVTIFSDSCLYSMIRQEKQEKGSYEAVFHNLTTEQADRLMENGYVRKVWKLSECTENDTDPDRACYGVGFRKISFSVFDHSQKVGAQIGMDPLPEEEMKPLYFSGNRSRFSSFNITFNNKLLGYYGINAFGTTAGSAWSILLLDFVIILFAAVMLYYVVLSGLSEKLRTVGLLDGIGISDKQKKIYVFGENILAGLVAVPLGMVLGFAALAVGVDFLNEKFLPATEIGIHVRWFLVAAVPVGCFLLILFSGTGLYARAKKERILNLITNYDEEEEINRTAVLLSAKRHFFRVETLLAVKNIIINHKTYVVTSTLLVIALCVFLNGTMYIQGLRKPFVDIPVYPKVSLWMEGEGSDWEKFLELEKELEKMEGIARVSVVREADRYTALEGMTQKELDEYLKEINVSSDELHRYGIYDFEIAGQYQSMPQSESYDLAVIEGIVRILGVDDETLERYRQAENVSGEVPEDGAVLLSMEEEKRESFPLMVRTEKTVLPVVLQIYPDQDVQMLLPEYLMTAEKSQNWSGHFSGNKSRIVCVSMETFDRLLASYPESSIVLQIVLDRDQGEMAAMNDILYPEDVTGRIRGEEAVRRNIRKTAEKLGLGNLSIYSFAEEYQQSFFQGGKGFHILLVAAALSATWAAAVLVLFQKDAACIRRRRREFALLLTIGMTRGRVFKMIFLEHLLYAAVGLGVGIPLSIWILSGLYADGGANQMASAFDVPVVLVRCQVILTLFVVILPFFYTLRELMEMDMITVIRKEE